MSKILKKIRKIFKKLLFLRFFALLTKLLAVISISTAHNLIPISKTITCNFDIVQWFYFNSNLRTCSAENLVINDTGFTIVHPLLLSVKAVDMTDNARINFLPEKMAEKFPNLVAISFRDCSIEYVNENHFKDLHELVSLNLALNRIEMIESGAFDDNSKLEVLKLNNNNITSLGDNLFDRLLNLKELHLANNKIAFIDPRTFQNLANIQEISLANNKLEMINENLLANNGKLEIISFGDNYMKSIDSKMFDGKKKLISVDFERNFCIDDFYEKENFEDMKRILIENCTIESVGFIIEEFRENEEIGREVRDMV